MKKINRRNTDCVKWDLAKEDEIPMWVADMDIEIPDCVKEALIKRVEHGVFGYPIESDRYFLSVIEFFKRRHNLTVNKENIITTPGVVYAIKIAIQAFTKENESIIVLEPCYYPFKKSIKMAGRKAVVSTLVDEEGEYRVDYKDFEDKIRDNHVKMFIMSNPHNPVMKAFKQEELEMIGEICHKHEVLVLSDEIHCDFTFNGAKHIPFFNVEEGFGHFSIIMTSPSKTFNLAGLEGSNILFENSELRDKFKKTRDTLGNSMLNVMALEATIAAYNEGDKWIEETKKIIKANFDYLDDYLKKNLPKVKLMKHEATYLAWLDFRELNLKYYELEKLIRTESKVWLNEGYIFGSGGAGFERINLACHIDTLKEALDRIKASIDKLEK